MSEYDFKTTIVMEFPKVSPEVERQIGAWMQAMIDRQIERCKGSMRAIEYVTSRPACGCTVICLGRVKNCPALGA